MPVPYAIFGASPRASAYREVGKLLLEAKEQCEHGEFKPWIKSLRADVAAYLRVTAEKIAKVWLSEADHPENEGDDTQDQTDHTEPHATPGMLVTLLRHQKQTHPLQP